MQSATVKEKARLFVVGDLSPHAESSKTLLSFFRAKTFAERNFF
jgi:hypothetical protein